MGKRTCAEAGCQSGASSRGLCNKHYLRAIRSGAIIPERKPANSIHSLSDVDVDTKTGICSICGPVEVRLRPGRGRECMTQARRRRGHSRPTAKSATARRLLKYGLTKEQYDALVEAAGGTCQICGVAFGDEFHVDHCHETGLVRGLLCRRCNYALGWMDDSPPRLLAAYMYLKAAGIAEDDWRHRG